MIEDSHFGDATIIREGLKRLQCRLAELSGKTKVRQKEEAVQEFRKIFETLKPHIYSSVNNVIKPSLLVDTVTHNAKMECDDNYSKKGKPSIPKSSGLDLYIMIVKHVTEAGNVSFIEEHGLNLLTSLCELQSHPFIVSHAHYHSPMADLLLRFVTGVKMAGIPAEKHEDLWGKCWTWFANAVEVNLMAASSYLKTLCMLLRECESNLLSHKGSVYIKTGLSTLFANLKFEESRRWSASFCSVLLEFSSLVLDRWGFAIHSEKYLGNMFDLAECVIGKITLESTENDQLWPFFDHLTSVGMPDCRISSASDERVYSIARTALASLTQELSKMSLRTNYEIPREKIPLFAKFIVIAEVSGFVDFHPQNEVQHSKKMKQNSIFEDDNEHSHQPSRLTYIAAKLSLLKDIIANWHHRLGPSRLSRLAEVTFGYKRELTEAQFAPFCQVYTELLRCDAMGDSSSVKRELNLELPMQNPVVRIKTLWKFAVSAAHSHLAAESAMELMQMLILKFKEILCDGDENKIIESVCSILPSNINKFTASLLSTLLSELEFNESGVFPGAENREAGITQFRFRCQIAEWLLTRFPWDISEQLFQLCCCHPHRSTSQRKKSEKTGIAADIDLLGLSPSVSSSPSEPVALIRSCLCHEVLEYIVNLIQDLWLQENISIETKFVHFNSFLMFSDRIHSASVATNDSIAYSILHPLLMSVNQWLEKNVKHFPDSQLSSLDPGRASRLVSSSAKMELERVSCGCPILSARFGFTGEIALENFVRFVEEASRLIRENGDFTVSNEQGVKIEQGSHHIDLTSTKSFTELLGEKMVSFAETYVDYLPDLLLLLEKAGDLLSEEHLEILVRKTFIIVEEDSRENTEKETLLAKTIAARTVLNTYRRAGRPFDVSALSYLASVEELARTADYITFDPKRVLVPQITSPLFHQRILGRLFSTAELWPSHVDALCFVIPNETLYKLCLDYVPHFQRILEFHEMSISLKSIEKASDRELEKRLNALKYGNSLRRVIEDKPLGIESFPMALQLSHAKWPLLVKSFWILFEDHPYRLLAMLKHQAIKHIELGLQHRFAMFLSALCSGMPELSDNIRQASTWVVVSSLCAVLESIPCLTSDDPIVKEVLSVVDDLNPICDGLRLLLRESLPEAVHADPHFDVDVESVCFQNFEQFVQQGTIQDISLFSTASFWDGFVKYFDYEKAGKAMSNGVFLFDRILLHWELHSRFRPQMARVLHFFNESVSMRVERRPLKITDADSLQTFLWEFCHSVILNARSVDVDSTESALNIVFKFEGTAKDPPAKSKESPVFTLCYRLLDEGISKFDTSSSKMLMIIRSSIQSLPLLSHMVCRHICHPDTSTAAIFVRFVNEFASRIERDNDVRLVRTLCECVDAIGLGELAMVECDGGEFLTLGHLAVEAGFNEHAFALANLAFDRVIGSSRKLAAFGGHIPQNEHLERLFCKIYLATNNSQALDSLPSYIQMDPRVQLLRATVNHHWLQVVSSQVATPKQKSMARWYCGIEGITGGYMDSVIKGKFDEGYPKRMRTHWDRLFVLIRNQRINGNIFADEITKIYVNELASKDFICPQICKDYADLHILLRKQLSTSVLESLSTEQLLLLTWKMLRHCLVLLTSDCAKEVVSDYCGCFETTILLLLDKLKKKKGYAASLNIVSTTRDVIRNFPELELLVRKLNLKECEVDMEMGCHQIAEHKLYEIAVGINLLVSSPTDSSVSTEDEEIGVDLICLLANIQAEYSSRNVEQAINTVQILDNCNVKSIKAHKVLFELAVRQLFEMEAHMQSPMIKLRKEARDSHKEELQAIRHSRFAGADEQKRSTIVSKEYNCENEELSRLDKKLDEAVVLAVQSGFEYLELICHPLKRDEPVPEEYREKTMRVIFPLIDMIFRYEHISAVATVLNNHMFRYLNPSVWLCAVPHLLPHCFRKGNLSQVVQDLILKLIIAYPYHVLMAVLSYKYDVNKIGLVKECPKSQMVDTLLSRAMKSEKGMESVVKDMVEAHRIYRKFVWIPLKRGNISVQFTETVVKGAIKYKMSKDCDLLANIDVLRRVPLPTVTQTVGKAKDYSKKGLILWKDIDAYCDKADGNSSPKIIKVRGSDGRIYKLVWKDGESVRQDCLVQDLFSVMSGIFEDHPLRTYNVLPLDSHSGIIEFCGGTQSMKDLLIGSDSISGLHKSIHPDEDVHAVRKQMANRQTGGHMLSEDEFQGALESITPVFRHHFYRNFPSVYDWTMMLRHYTRNLAQWSIVCYVVGLGDRHGSNVLFEPRSSSFVHIDLGMILEFSKRILPIPELVPFRLTRDIMDPILVQGVKGSLLYDAAEAMSKLRKHKEVILGVASVFLRETVSNFRDVSNDSQRSFASATAFARLQSKLNGTDATISPLPPFEQAQRLLHEATSIPNLSKLFHGWLAII